MEKDFDIDAILAELDDEFKEEETSTEDDGSLEEQDDEEQTNDETLEDSEEEDAEEDSEEESEDEEEEESEEETEGDEDLHKRNAAFKKLREERDALSVSDKFLDELASQYGLSKEQLMERFRSEQATKVAKEKGMPVEEYKRLRDMEAKLAEIEERSKREVFNVKAEAFATKHNLKQKDLIAVFEEASNLGLNVADNPNLLEMVYRNMNYEKAVEKGRQEQLELSKKRKSSSVGSSSVTGKTKQTQVEADWEKEIDEVFAANYITKPKK